MEDPMSLLDETVAAVTPLRASAVAEAGEGSGAALALPIVQSAARVLRDVATFDSAGVSSEKE
jgi:NaMN:DMB phosphoribosyltransferase